MHGLGDDPIVNVDAFIAAEQALDRFIKEQNLSGTQLDPLAVQKDALDSWLSEMGCIPSVQTRTDSSI